MFLPLARAVTVFACALLAHAEPPTNSPSTPSTRTTSPAAPAATRINSGSELDPAVLRSVVEKRFAEMDGAPGAVVGVRAGDSSPTFLAIGTIDQEKSAPMTVERPFRIASASKPFLGNLVLLLADAGMLSIDDPISKYVDGVPKGDKITLRMLGNNTSGIFNSIADKSFREAIAANPERVWTAPEILKYALAHDLEFEPGTKWSYSNTNSVLLGEAVRKVLNQPWPEAMKTRVLDQLKLAHTGVGIPVGDGSSPGAGFALPKGYRYARAGAPVNYGDQWIDASAFSASWADAAGDMYSTAGDLVLAAEPLLTGKMLSDNSKKELLAWVDTGHKSTATPNSKAETIYYGFCVGKRSLDARPWVGHTGDVPGFSSFMVYEPTSRTTIVVLANLSNTKFRLNPAEEIGEAIIAKMNEQPNAK